MFPEDVEIATDIDFGNIELSTVAASSGTILDGDGVRRSRDGPLGDWEITLCNGVDFFTTTTDPETGEYRFNNVRQTCTPSLKRRNRVGN